MVKYKSKDIAKKGVENMKKYLVCIALMIAFAFSVSGCTFGNDKANENSNFTEETVTGEIKEISVDDVSGITAEEAEQLCYNILGEKDDETGFLFSFGVSGAVEKDNKQYYVIRASWLVNNSHLSYIGDFFVSADGKQVYDGLAGPDGYEMINIIWSKF